jgi:hypothetical protein
VDSNAIECLRNFSCECLDLFTPEIIYQILQVCEAVICTIPTNYGDKLIEAVINITFKLPSSEKIQAQRRILMFLLTELQAASPLGLQSRPQVYHKGIVIISAAFGAMNDTVSTEVWSNLSDIILSVVEIALKGFSVYNSQENLVSAALLLFRRVIKLTSVFSDTFFSSICDTIMQAYKPGKEEGISVIVTGISLLFNEPNTSNWIKSTYMKLFELIYTSISQSLTPDSITIFYDLQTKLYESGSSIFAETLLKTLELSASISASLNERNSSKSFLMFCQLIFSTRIDELAQFPFLITRGLVCGLGNLSINIHAHLSNVFNNFKKFYINEFYQGVTQALTSDVFTRLQDSEKERVLFCFIQVDLETIHSMKKLVNVLSNILRGQATFDSIIEIEIGVSSKNIMKNVIEVDN